MNGIPLLKNCSPHKRLIHLRTRRYYSVVTSRGDVYLLEPEESASEGRSPHTRPHPVSVKCLLTEVSPLLQTTI